MRILLWLIVKTSALIVNVYHKIRELVQRFDRAMQTRYRPRQLALVAVLVIAAVSALMLFFPPYLGLSNDGSFDAVLADVGLARMDPSDTSAYFSYYEREYLVSTTANAPGTTPLLLRMMVRLAVLIDEAITWNGMFDVRFLAAIYLVIYLVLLYLLLSHLLQRVGVYTEGLLLAIFAVLIFGDSTLITRFASFYTQPLELILLVGIAACVQWIPQQLENFLPQVLMAVLLMLLMTVNEYCALIGLVFSLAYWLLMRYQADSRHQGLYALLAICLCAMSIIQTGNLVGSQTVNEKVDQMTRGVLFQATDPEEALAQFGIEGRYAVLADAYSTQSYPVVLPESGALDEGFLDKYTTADVVMYYLRHPTHVFGLFEEGVSSAFFMRTDFSGNYEQSSGMPERAKTLFMALWSTFKEQSAPQTAASLLLMLLAFLLLRGRSQASKRETKDQAGAYTMLCVVMFVALSVEMLTVVVMSGDSLLIRESFLMGCLIDQMAIMACTEGLRKIKTIETET